MVTLIWRCVVLYTLGMLAVGFAIGFVVAQPESTHRPVPVMAAPGFEPGFEPDDEADFDRRV